MLREELRQFRLIPVVVIDDSQDASPLAEAIVSGGLGCAEITLRTDDALEAINIMAARNDLVIGAGTVFSVEQAKAALDNGATFIVAPGLSMNLVEWCLKSDVPVFPGCATATEITWAQEAGLDTVKFFPAEQLGGAKMLSSLASVFRNMEFMPTGGISAGNLEQYLAISQVAACGGSWMVQSQWIKTKQFEKIREEVKQVVDLLNSL